MVEQTPGELETVLRHRPGRRRSSDRGHRTGERARGDALRVQTLCQLLRGLLSAAVGVDIEGEINRAWTVAQLLKLFSAEMGAQRAGGVAKTCLPQHREIEQTFNQNHRGKLANQFPCEQAALGA